MFYVYAIKSERDGRIYVGMCSEVKARLKEHNAGKTKSTKGYTPWKLIYFEEKPDRIEARKREKYLKSGIGKEFLKSLVP
ncbi:MAG: GIY-YIG nuclease family protein [Chitinophagaceae bacterium]|nr:GIY-YIG nuclease family protein [Chitinophagaceae bacterium]